MNIKIEARLAGWLAVKRNQRMLGQIVSLKKNISMNSMSC